MKQTRIKILLKALTLFIILASLGCTVTTLYQPATIVLPKSVTKSKMRQAVVRAFNRRGWQIEKNWEELTQASIRKKQHIARVKVSYPGNQIVIKYLDSKELKYTVWDGTELIHHRYNIWVRNIEKDILDQLSADGAYAVVKSNSITQGTTQAGINQRKSSKTTKGNKKAHTMREGAVVVPDDDYY